MPVLLSSRTRVVLSQAAPTLFKDFVSQQNTTITNDLGPDGHSWAQSLAPAVDSYGCEVSLCSKEASGQRRLWLTYRNPSGAWQDQTSSPGDGLYPIPVTRGAMCWDSNNDWFYALYNGSNTDGMIIRRYKPTRDGSGNITALTKDANLSMQLDYQTDGTMTYTHPVAIWCADIGTNGAILCIWAARNSGGTKGNEVRSSMRLVSNTSADNTPANWTHLGSSSTTGIANAPQVPYTAWMTSNADTNAYGYPCVIRRSTGDLAVFYTAQVNAGTGWICRKATFSAGTWTLQSPTDIGEITLAGTNSGYNLKHELGSKPVEDASGNLFFATLHWKNNTDGDTWRVWKVSSGNTVTAIKDLYSGTAANAQQDIFITGDLLWSNGKLVASYTTVLTKDAYIAVMDASGTESQSRLHLTEATPWDIPCLYERGDGAVGILARNFNSPGSQQNPPTYTPPYLGYYGRLYWQ